MESESELSDFDDSELKDESADEAYLPAPSDQPKVEQKSKVNGLKHLISLKESLKLEEFQLKQSNKKARKKRQKERKRLKKLASKGLSDAVLVHTLATQVALKKGKVVKPPEVVVFESAKKKARH